MNDSETIVCKPTPWFTLRAVVMLLMFGVFAVLFYIDGSTGYRKKNVVFYLHKAFEQAGKDYSAMDQPPGTLTAADWKAHAAKQVVAFPEDRSVLPASIEIPMPWPDVLQDHERMKTQWNLLWREYSKEKGLDHSPPDHPYDAGKIREQWIVFGISSALALVSAFFLVRTMGRSLKVDATGVTTQQGKHIPFADLKKMDLRKWETKGLAFIDYEGASGSGKIRVDGLTYGGFKKENGEPAERLMQRIRSHFSGEIIEYAPVREEKQAEDVSSEA